MGGQGRAAGKSGRHAASRCDFDNADRWTIGEPDLVLRRTGGDGPGDWPRSMDEAVGHRADAASPKIATSRRSRSARSTTCREPARPTPVGGRYVFHHLNYSSAVPGVDGTATAGANAPSTTLARPRGRAQRRHLRARGGPPDGSQLSPAARLGAPALQRPRDEVAPRVRLQVLPERLYSRSTGASSVSTMGNGIDLDVKPNTGEPGAPLVRGAAGAHQDPHLRAAPACARRAHVPAKRSGATTSRR